jgi:hypothetical protein
MAFKSKILGAVLALLTVSLAANAQAQPLPAAVVSADFYDPAANPGYGSNAATASYQNGTAQISYNAQGGTLSAIAIPPNGGSASVTYWIEVLGPANVQVPVDLLAGGSTNQAGGYSGSMVTASLGSYPLLAACYANGAGLCNDPNSSASLSSTAYEVQANTPVQVQIAAVWNAASCCADGNYHGGTVSGSVSASAAIAAAWDQLGYTLISSASPIAVPEPATYGLMLAGLFLAFVVSRRGRKDHSTRA